MFEEEATTNFKKKATKIAEKKVKDFYKECGWEDYKYMISEFADVGTECFQKGAEYGYNKANEWHFVKGGDLPKDTTSLYLVRVYSWDFGLSHLYKKYGMYIPVVCEWKGEYFSALDEMAYSNARNIKNCIAWKEIIFLKESE